MKKFFVVGKNCVILGKESENSIKFTIGEILSNQTDFAEIRKIGDKLIIKKTGADCKYKEAIYMLLGLIEKNFPKNNLFIQKELVDEIIKNSIGRESKKYTKLTDVYANPLIVPWNFMATEVEDVLSFFNKNILKNRKTLYIGAGYGKNIWALRDKKYNIDAIEFSKTATKKANQIFGKDVVVHRDLVKYSGEKDKYDIILDIGCLHSIPKDNRKKAVENIYNLLKKDGILISRIFKPREKEWLNRMPFKTSDFGLDKTEIKELLKNFSVKNKYQNKDYIILEAKK